MIDIKIEGLESIQDAVENAVRNAKDEIAQETIEETLKREGLTRDQVITEKKAKPDGSMEVVVRKPP